MVQKSMDGLQGICGPPKKVQKFMCMYIVWRRRSMGAIRFSNPSKVMTQRTSVPVISHNKNVSPTTVLFFNTMPLTFTENLIGIAL